MKKEQIKNFFENKKTKVALIATPVATVCAAVPTFAGETDYATTISDAMTSAVQSIVNNTVSMAGSVLPIGLTVLGLYMTIKMGIKFIKTSVK